MTRSDPQRRPASSICASLLTLALLLLGTAAATPAQQPQADLQDPPDLVIFHTGEVKGALAPGG